MPSGETHDHSARGLCKGLRPLTLSEEKESNNYEENT